MPLNPFRSKAQSSPVLLKPDLEASEWTNTVPVSPDRLVNEAREVLLGHGHDQPARSAFMRASTSLLADHAQVSEAFGIMYPLPGGLAVALAEGAEEGLTVYARSSSWSGADLSGQEQPLMVRMAHAVVEHLVPDGPPLALAVVDAITETARQARWAALGMAVAEVLRSHLPEDFSQAALLRGVQRALSAVLDRPFSMAHLQGVASARLRHFSLVDTVALEHLHIAAPSSNTVGVGLLYVPPAAQVDAAFYRKRAQQARDVLERLQHRGFDTLPSLRALEHRDLQTALGHLSGKLRPVARHLVGENRRVQRFMAALRKEDWQMMGAILMISYGSMKDDWQCTSPLMDEVVDIATSMTLDGVLGITLSDPSGLMLLLGRPFMVPAALSAISDAIRERFGVDLHAQLL